MMAGFDQHSVCARCRDRKKGSDPCVETPPAACIHCDSLSSEQKEQLSTPSYKLKKEKREAKSSTPAKDIDTLSPTLVDLALVSVVGVVDGQSFYGLSGPVEKKKKLDKKVDKKSSSSVKSVKSDKSVKSSSSRPPATSPTDQGKYTTSSTNTRISDLDKKWSDRFNRLEALLMAKALDRPQDPVFRSVKVAPSRTPPAHVVRSDPFLKPVTQPSQPADTAVGPPATDLPQQKSIAKPSAQPEPSTAPTTAQTVQRQLSSVFDTSRKETPSSSDSESESFSSDRPPLDIFPEEGELSDDQEANLSDHDQSLSEEQSYRETMRGIRSYMDWNYIPDIDSGTTTSEDNPFTGPKCQ